MSSPTEITISQLSRLIATPAAPVIIDACIDDDFAADPRLIPSAFRHPFREVALLTSRLEGRRVVVYCQKGGKISQGAAAILRDHGIQAETLEGGQMAWVGAGEMLVPEDSIPARNTEGRTVWVTRHRPKIDRIACPWLIRRFVDPRAQFLFVAPSQVADVADKFDAIPFDVEDVFWSHRGDRCTFDTMIEEFDLGSEAMLRLATIVRGADTNQHDLAPQSAGLLAASLGMSRMYRDDLEQLDASMAIYDAFYRWSRDAVDETHDWPITPTKA
jgi:rhodanese-related sulfurtransferase